MISTCGIKNGMGFCTNMSLLEVGVLGGLSFVTRAVLGTRGQPQLGVQVGEGGILKTLGCALGQGVVDTSTEGLECVLALHE
jgi:hypothetical protein